MKNGLYESQLDLKKEYNNLEVEILKHPLGQGKEQRHAIGRPAVDVMLLYACQVLYEAS